MKFYRYWISRVRYFWKVKLIKELNITVGTTSADGLFTLQATRCLGCCGLAPVMVIGDTVYGKVDPKDIPKIISNYRE